MPVTRTNSAVPPPTPVAGDLWFNTTTGKEYEWYISPGPGGGAWHQVEVTSTTPPQTGSGPVPPPAGTDGDTFYDTDNNREYVWYTSPSTGLGAWVETPPNTVVSKFATAPAPPPIVPVPGPHDVTRVPTLTVSQVPPTSPAPLPGDLWWSTLHGQLFILYDDGNTVQWVLSNHGGGSGTLPDHTHTQDDIIDLPHITVAPTPPSYPKINDIWVDTS